ncbi:hypothetical protein [Ruminococcus sp.]|uniref:hypothetical protein n=1 Tax=Ruminococcus sp. TaxID=41978 RepID=UPI0025DA43F0|nr:hypothetical protein [Ruminococcus sp.]MBQ8967273.1 hypothetical protein [Ruminococcus sp.]
MKANIPGSKRTVIDLKEALGDSKKVTEELENIVANFEKWLEISSLTLGTFTEAYSSAENFSLLKKQADDYTVICMVHETDRGYANIGETLAYPTADESARYDMILLLMYIACRLDEHDKTGRRNYFFDITKKFCMTLDDKHI